MQSKTCNWRSWLRAKLKHVDQWKIVFWAYFCDFSCHICNLDAYFDCFSCMFLRALFSFCHSLRFTDFGSSARYNVGTENKSWLDLFYSLFEHFLQLRTKSSLRHQLHVVCADVSSKSINEEKPSKNGYLDQKQNEISTLLISTSHQNYIRLCQLNNLNDDSRGHFRAKDGAIQSWIM